MIRQPKSRQSRIRLRLLSEIIKNKKKYYLLITSLTMNYTTIPKSICQLQTGNGKPTDIYV